MAKKPGHTVFGTAYEAGMFTKLGPLEPLKYAEQLPFLLENAAEARANGYDLVCAECGCGINDDFDLHDQGDRMNDDKPKAPYIRQRGIIEGHDVAIVAMSQGDLDKVRELILLAVAQYGEEILTPAFYMDRHGEEIAAVPVVAGKRMLGFVELAATGDDRYEYALTLLTPTGDGGFLALTKEEQAVVEDCIRVAHERRSALAQRLSDPPNTDHSPKESEER